MTVKVRTISMWNDHLLKLATMHAGATDYLEDYRRLRRAR